jgi:transcriptional regulator with XRE-family HTH domain
VLAEARALLGRSPEQVGAATGLSGRTIRRLERGLIRRPHTTTLETLADFYALDARVLHRLLGWAELDGDALLRELRRLDETAPTEFSAVQLAMRAARRGVDDGRGGDQGHHPDHEIAAIVEDFLALDRRRRTHLRFLLHDLRSAAERERGAPPS